MAKKEEVEAQLKEIAEELRELFPHGHKDYIPMLLENMKLHSEKNYGYAFGGDALGNFNRVSVIKQLYPNMDWSTPVGVAIGYLLKQFDAGTWQLSEGYKDKGGEIPARRYRDVTVYSGIIEIQLKEEKKNETQVKLP